jgi:hypothetical protein
MNRVSRRVQTCISLSSHRFCPQRSLLNHGYHSPFREGRSYRSKFPTPLPQTWTWDRAYLNKSPSITNSPLDISRLWLLVRLLKFGIRFSDKKMDALLRGDQSGTVVDRAFVCGSHVLGMMSSAGMDNTPAMVLFHARRVQTAWESLAELFGGDDYRTKVQAAALVVSSHVYMCMPQMALLYIQKSCDFIKAGNLRFVPTYGRPPEFSEDLHETLVALSQTIYWANYLFLMCGGPEPRSTAELEKQFRHELPVREITSAFPYIKFIFCYSKPTRFSLRSAL